MLFSKRKDTNFVWDTFILDKKAHDENYGEVNFYPAEAWKEVYKIEIKEIV